MRFSAPLRVGIVGTGFAAKLRAELFSQDPRTQVLAIAGHPDRARALAAEFDTACCSWQDLVAHPDIDLVVVSNANGDRDPVVAALLEAGKSAIVEYPLSLSYPRAVAFAQMARERGLFLHVEHIELLGGVHRAVVEHLPAIGEPFYARYETQTPQRPAPDKWTYQPQRFGFPLVASVSRLRRLTELFGRVTSVSCQVRYDGEALPDRYTSCACQAQLRFASGLLADVGYRKGEAIWQASRVMEVHGRHGAILFQGEEGKLVTPEGETPLVVPPPRGSFKRDTEQAIAHLLDGTPLYASLEGSLYALAVAAAAETAAQSGRAEPVL